MVNRQGQQIVNRNGKYTSRGQQIVNTNGKYTSRGQQIVNTNGKYTSRGQPCLTPQPLSGSCCAHQGGTISAVIFIFIFVIDMYDDDGQRLQDSKTPKNVNPWNIDTPENSKTIKTLRPLRISRNQNN